eukprot:14008664-Alexandrium_andersonii.AAC.1
MWPSPRAALWRWRPGSMTHATSSDWPWPCLPAIAIWGIWRAQGDLACRMILRVRSSGPKLAPTRPWPHQSPTVLSDVPQPGALRLRSGDRQRSDGGDEVWDSGLHSGEMQAPGDSEPIPTRCSPTVAIVFAMSGHSSEAFRLLRLSLQFQ